MSKKRREKYRNTKENKRPSLIRKVTNRLTTFSDPQIAIFLFLFAMLLGTVVLIDYTNSPFYDGLVWDAKVYYDWAKTILAGDIIGKEIYHQSPLYPYFLALIMKVFGGSHFLIYFIQIVLSAVTASILFYIGKHYQNKNSGILISLIFIFYGMFTFYALKVLTETLSIFLYVLLFYLVLKSQTKQRWALSGVVLGLLTVCRADAMVLVPFVFFYLLLCFNEYGFRKKIAFFSCLLVAFFLVISIPTIRNYIVGKDFVLVASGGGENFYIGNNEKATGIFTRIEGVSPDIEYQDEDVLTVAQKKVGRSIKRSEASKFWFREGIKFIKNNFRSYPALELKKLKYIFSGPEYSSMYYRYFEQNRFTHTLKLLFVNFYYIFALWLTGFFSYLKEWKKYFLLYSMVVFGTLKILIFFYDVRFRLPMIPFLIIFAVMGLYKIYSSSYKDRKIQLNAYVIIFLGLLVLTVPICGYESERSRIDSHLYYTLGEIYYEENQLDEARDAYYQSSNLNKNSWMPVFGMAKVLFAQGNIKYGIDLYQEAFSNVNKDFQKLILRDKDFDPIRAHIMEQGTKSSKLAR